MSHILNAFKFSKNYKTFHIGFSLWLVLVNGLMLRGLFSEGSIYIDTNSMYGIMLLFILPVLF